MTRVYTQVTVLGATGSIGRSTLDVIARHPDRYRIFALTANQQIDILYPQCLQHRPCYAVVVDKDAANQLRQRLAQVGSKTVVLSGEEALCMVANHEGVDVVMAAIVGAAGLASTLAAARAGKRVLLANKESLVLAGQLFMDAVHQGGATLLPIDSEHNAIFQCLPHGYLSSSNPRSGIARILLTASGGPFRTRPIHTFETITPEEACAHPRWNMGRKISVDSASMMNKGLEVIEAHWLFAVPGSAIQVVVHPQSIIHSMVAYVDGSVLAQMGNPDMRTPIAHALAYPERIDSGVAPLNLFEVASLQFEAPDFRRFPCLKLAFESLAAGGGAPGVMNAANEEAVAAFLNKQIRFTEIPSIVEAVLSSIPTSPVSTLEAVFALDTEARAAAQKVIKSYTL